MCNEGRESMKRITTAVALITGVLLAIAGSAAAQANTPQGQAQKPSPVNITLLTISDWHGQIPPVGSVGGAAALATYLKQEKAANPNSLAFMAGDSFGATPPISSFFEDE